MVNTLIIFWAVTLFGGLLFFVKNRNLKGKLATKAILSCLFIFSGAASFYISDLFVARDRFLKMEFKNRLLGLPLYYFGQFLLAFSVGAVK
jgi:hypothetical protein